jgi:hypothetical protein
MKLKGQIKKIIQEGQDFFFLTKSINIVKEGLEKKKHFPGLPAPSLPGHRHRLTGYGKLHVIGSCN